MREWTNEEKTIDAAITIIKVALTNLNDNKTAFDESIDYLQSMVTEFVKPSKFFYEGLYEEMLRESIEDGVIDDEAMLNLFDRETIIDYVKSKGYTVE